VSGCDLGRPEASGLGPNLHLVGVFPPDGCGVGPDPECTVPTNSPLTLRFDRFLDPVTAVRQSLQVYPADPALGVPFTFDVAYDPIERVVEYRVPPGAAYKPHTLYQVELLVPEAASDPGFRAFDGAPLAETKLPVRFSFLTADAPAELAEPPPVASCDAVVKQVFGTLGHCATLACHRQGGDGADLLEAPHQLWLEDRSHFALSAIGRVAKQTDLGDVSGGPSTPRGPRFGVRMALVEPSNPGASYLLYKLLLGPANFSPCDPESGPAVCSAAVDPPTSTHQLLPLGPGERLEPSADELARLREWFVRGEPMPRGGGSVTLEGLRALSGFIAAGARCD
jgi:hypothetical protein